MGHMEGVHWRDCSEEAHCFLKRCNRHLNDQNSHGRGAQCRACKGRGSGGERTRELTSEHRRAGIPCGRTEASQGGVAGADRQTHCPSVSLW